MAKKGFQLKSGNQTSFKMMGSSPMQSQALVDAMGNYHRAKAGQGGHLLKGVADTARIASANIAAGKKDSD